MANILTDLAADIYKAADVVARELTGTIAASTINADGSERVAKGDVVRSSFTRPAESVDIVESMTIPEGTDQTIDNKTATITKSKAVQIPWTGEDMRSVNNGAGFETIYGDQVAQAMRTLTNEVELDSFQSLALNASRAVGVAGTNPFDTNFDLIAQGRQILVDNGAPTNDRRISLVMNTTSGTGLRNLAQLQKANENGSDEMLRQGTLLDLQGVMMRETGAVYSHVAGDASGYLVNGGSAKGNTLFGIDTGTGTFNAGDVIRFGSDTDQYVLNRTIGPTGAAINEPGFLRDIQDDEAITAAGNYRPNVMFHQAAHEIIVRPPAVPEGGDSAIDSMMVQDPRSGLLFEIRAYNGYRKKMFEVSLAWGVKTWLPKYVALVLG